jgi:hypothetical protein
MEIHHPSVIFAKPAPEPRPEPEPVPQQLPQQQELRHLPQQQQQPPPPPEPVFSSSHQDILATEQILNLGPAGVGGPLDTLTNPLLVPSCQDDFLNEQAVIDSILEEEQQQRSASLSTPPVSEVQNDFRSANFFIRSQSFDREQSDQMSW